MNSLRFHNSSLFTINCQKIDLLNRRVKYARVFSVQGIGNGWRYIVGYTHLYACSWKMCIFPPFLYILCKRSVAVIDISYLALTFGCSRIGTKTFCDTLKGFSRYISAYFCSLDGKRPVV